MPTYLYQCADCVKNHDVFKALSLLNREEYCETCKTPMARLLCAPAVASDFNGYSCPITGKWIEGRRAHTENLKRHNCRVYETGETDQAKQAQACRHSQEERGIDDTVDQFYEALPTAKKEQLAVEVASGLDLAVQRK